MDLSILPLLNAVLNGCSALLLLAARSSIRKKEVARHKRLMLSALAVSSLFLVSYLFYHSQHGSQHFATQGVIRIVYLTVLVSHTILAASLVVLVPIAVRRGLIRNDKAHKRIAPWAYRIWLYVSVTGVLIYLMLYQLDPILTPHI